MNFKLHYNQIQKLKTSLDGNLLYDLNEQHQQLNVIYLSEPFMDQKDIGEVEVK